ncbi:hypothetical protein GlitD10_2431 [Gloeomargarita lithophora Alchichica-D10]|uniref:PepSY domain-containing protein n=1 Tax=Gloeomargarita lithophora Alchichica-D10 TaxID=1188229 RepID=A0A1J0AFS2_9CYAN|nr:hypothetical protein GlitD10_2431 [Gloeomargarita lithophora Alchichica-D10]
MKIPTVSARKLRSLAFHSHRWLGLVGGLLLCIAGLTGAVLVFWHEIDHWVIAQRFGQVIRIGEPVAVAAIADRIKSAYSNPTQLALACVP